MVDPERGKPTQDKLTLRFDFTPVETASLLKYALVTIERDEPLKRRLGAKLDDFKSLASSLIQNGELDVSMVREKGIDPNILVTKARTIATSFKIKMGGR